MIRRIYEVDPLRCRCGEKMRILSFILDPGVINKLLQHVEREYASPRASPAANRHRFVKRRQFRLRAEI